MSSAVMSFYKYISKRLYDQSFLLCIQIINHVEMCWGVNTPPPSHHGYAPRLCTTVMHHGYAPRLCTTVMHHGYAPRLCTTVMHHGYAPRLCTTVMHHGYAPRLCTTVMHHGCAPRLCTRLIIDEFTVIDVGIN